jgi:hypothetical protein
MNRRFFVGVLALGLAVSQAWACGPAEETTAKGKTIDVVICLDVSNSMDGLIASAKVKLWDIVNELARAKPTPTLRVGLYSYGNDNYPANIGWIRKDLDLTNDLDALYQKLNALTTQGGTEYVTRVCRDAIQQQKWADGKDALKIIFVCGNEPASQDPVVKLAEAATLAKNKGVIINPIYCGGADDADALDWRQFAALCGGRFANINQDGGAVAIATPQDKELAELSEKLNTTYVMYGKDAPARAANQAAQDANAAKLGASVAAARAGSKASGVYQNEAWDLVDRLKKDPKLDIKKIPENELCEELRKLSADKREAYVKEKATEREALQKKIGDLNMKRQAYIETERKKSGGKADKLFDEAVKGALREQAKTKGIEIPEK